MVQSPTQNESTIMPARFGKMTSKFFAGAGALTLALVVSACATGTSASRGVGERHVTLTTPDGSVDALLFTPGRTKAPAVLLWTDLGGLRPHIAELGRKLANQGYVVLAPNEFYRSAKLDGTTPTDVEFRVRFSEWRAAATDDAVISDAKAYMRYLDALPQVDQTKKAGAVGFDIGGAYAFIAARALPDRIGAVVAIHPLAIATARPNSPHLFVNQSKAAYYVAFATDDDKREPEDKTDVVKAFEDARLHGKVEVLPGNHGFGLADNAAYDAASFEKAWSAARALLAEALN